MKQFTQNVSRKPDFKLSALNKTNEHKGKVGAAWKNPDGTISIALDPFVALSANDNLLITLFPNE